MSPRRNLENRLSRYDKTTCTDCTVILYLVCRLGPTLDEVPLSSQVTFPRSLDKQPDVCEGAAAAAKMRLTVGTRVFRYPQPFRLQRELCDRYMLKHVIFSGYGVCLRLFCVAIVGGPFPQPVHDEGKHCSLVCHLVI